jgi:hypothetical protein
MLLDRRGEEMKRLRKRGLVVTAVVVFSAFVNVASASATDIWRESGVFYTSSYPTKVANNASNDKIQIGLFGGESTVTCNFGIKGTFSTPEIPYGAVDRLVVDPTFTNCTSTASKFPTTATVEGCQFGLIPTFKLTVDCDPGDTMIFTSFLKKTELCSVYIGPQFWNSFITEYYTLWDGKNPKGIRGDIVNQGSQHLQYYAEGAYCTEKGFLENGNLNSTFDIYAVS